MNITTPHNFAEGYGCSAYGKTDSYNTCTTSGSTNTSSNGSGLSLTGVSIILISLICLTALAFTLRKIYTIRKKEKISKGMRDEPADAKKQSTKKD